MEKTIDYSEIEQYARHGGAYDRGSSDYWYWRDPDPHYYADGVYSSERITNLTADELAAYWQGYKDFQADDLRKDWGEDD